MRGYKLACSGSLGEKEKASAATKARELSQAESPAAQTASEEESQSSSSSSSASAVDGGGKESNE